MAVIQIKRGTAADWLAANPVLALGELGLETDTNKLKAGNGTSSWFELQYIAGSGGGAGAVLLPVLTPRQVMLYSPKQTLDWIR